MQTKHLIPKYIDQLRIIGILESTRESTKYHLLRFTGYLEERGIYDIEQLRPDTISDYQEELSWYITRKGTLMKKSTQSLTLTIIKGFCRWLNNADYLAGDPAKHIRLPKQPKTLPCNILEIREIKKLITKPDTQTITGYRDRLVLELLYSTGIRRTECSNIKIEDVDCDNGYLRINSGKGDKDRVVPLGKVACELSENYIIAIRPELLQRRDDRRDEGYLILNRWGKKMHNMGIYEIVRKYTKLSKQKKTVSPHTFRRSCTTHMLKKGANIRHLQEMLGHSNINSTQVYIKLSINDLKKAHAKYHPREKDS